MHPLQRGARAKALNAKIVPGPISQRVGAPLTYAAEVQWTDVLDTGYWSGAGLLRGIPGGAAGGAGHCDESPRPHYIAGAEGARAAEQRGGRRRWWCKLLTLV